MPVLISQVQINLESCLLTSFPQAHLYKKSTPWFKMAKPITDSLQSSLTGSSVCCKRTRVITAPSRAHPSYCPTLVLLQSLVLVLHLILLPLFTHSYCRIGWSCFCLCGNAWSFVPCGTTWSRASGSLSFKKSVAHRSQKTVVQWTTALYLSAHYPYTDLSVVFNLHHFQSISDSIKSSMSTHGLILNTFRDRKAML